MKKLLKNPLFYLGIILAIALVVRVLEINKTSFWYDEAFTGDTVQMPWGEMFNVIARDKVHPPLYYMMTKVWGYAVGYSQIALRGFSILWGMLGVVAAYKLAKEFFDKQKEFPKTGLIAAFVLAVSPYFIAYSIEARSYAFLALLAICLAFTSLKYLKAAESIDKKKFLALSILIGLTMCFTHYLQIIYVIGIGCAVFVYTKIYTEKGLNKKLLYSCVTIASVGIILLALLPVREFLQSKGVQGSWWIHMSRVDDIARVYYSYLFGVVRYANGVPPQREFMISIAPQIMTGILFMLHIFGFAYILNDKKLSLDTKRNATFFFVLSLITFVGFMSLSLINFNTFIERYMIGAGVILLISIAITLSLCFRAFKWKIITTLAIYLIFIHLLQPLPELIDYRVIAEGLTKENKAMNIQRDIYQSPADMINTMYYTGRENAYYLFNFVDEYEGWALINNNRGVRLQDIGPNDFFIVTLDQRVNFVGKGFKEVKQLDNNLAILQRN